MEDQRYNGPVSECTLARDGMKAAAGQTTDLCLLMASSASIRGRTASGCSQRCWGEPLRRCDNGGERGSATYVPSRATATSAVPWIVPSSPSAAKQFTVNTRFWPWCCNIHSLPTARTGFHQFLDFDDATSSSFSLFSSQSHAASGCRGIQPAGGLLLLLLPISMLWLT